MLGWFAVLGNISGYHLGYFITLPRIYVTVFYDHYLPPLVPVYVIPQSTQTTGPEMVIQYYSHQGNWMRTAARNAKILVKPGKLATVNGEMSRYQVNVLGLTELIGRSKEAEKLLGGRNRVTSGVTNSLLSTQAEGSHKAVLHYSWIYDQAVSEIDYIRDRLLRSSTPERCAYRRCDLSRLHVHYRR